MSKEQLQVVLATEKRGYKSGWSPVQFLARQVCKLQEELGELADLFENMPVADVPIFSTVNLNLDYIITQTGKKARKAFDRTAAWERVSSIDYEDVEQTKKELADLQVVLFNAAGAIEDITGQPFDIIQAAVEKAEADIKRGVR